MEKVPMTQQKKRKERKLPSHAQCLKWVNERNPKNIVQHSLQVNKVAMVLGKKLKEKGEKIDLELLDRASLLHDLDKFETLGTGKHAFTAGKILRKKGFTRLAEVVEHHLTHRVLENDFDEWPWEDKLVNYADRRVTHTEITTIEKRMNYLIFTYGKTQKIKNTLIKAGKKFKAFEKKLEQILGQKLNLKELK